MKWVFVGSSSEEKNEDFLRDALARRDPDDEYVQWLARPWSVPAYWWRASAGDRGVRLPFDLGSRSWEGEAGIPKEFDKFMPIIKLGVLGGSVVTSLGLDEDVPYELPASLVPQWPPDLDAWAKAGARAFAHELLRALLHDIAWHHTAIQTYRDREWRKKWARERLAFTIVTEARLSELRVQRDAETNDEWFGDDSSEDVKRIDRLLGLALERVRHARELERDEIQLELLTATHALSEVEREHREARDREIQATEQLTRRLTLLSAVFLPGTLASGILGANWDTGPLPGGWSGLLIAVGIALGASLAATVAAVASWLAKRTAGSRKEMSGAKPRPVADAAVSAGEPTEPGPALAHRVDKHQQSR